MKGINPYTPGAGTRPEPLGGRDQQVAIVRSLADQVDGGREANPIVFIGLRGVGKTSLLYEIRDMLRQRGWMAGYYEVRRDVEPGQAIRTIVTDSANELPNSKLRAALPGALARIGGMKLALGPAGVGFTVDTRATVPPDPYDDLVGFLRSLGKVAKDHGTGVAIIVDELQVFRKRDLAILIQALGALRDLPIMFIGAGLPYLPAEMSKANTYTERFRFERLDYLTAQDAREAIIAPAFKQGVTWDSAAADRLVAESDGYPYLVQLFASESWNAASGDTITENAAGQGLTVARRLLDSGLYAARYERLSEGERQYVDAMAELMPRTGKRVGSGAVAAHLGKTLNGLGPVRDRIIRKGVIHSPTAGQLEFSVPGFVDYVRRRNA
ncbi:ATP-binding protein [Agromyces humi]|uniref:ATP-binding protein n=1 Tax=Agromyces humi TaxID=1766800 RepID=UPI00135876AA|nr:ATP-binding protein [Agromyces humi]